MLIDPRHLFARPQTAPPARATAPVHPPVQGFGTDGFQPRLGAVSQLLGLQPASSQAGPVLADPGRLFGARADKDQIVDTGRKDVQGRPIRLSREAAAGLEKMHQIAQSRGISLKVTSGHRTIEHQHELWENALKKYGSEAEARHWVAPPGKSRHNYGKAIDMHMYRGDKRIPQQEFDQIIALAGMYRPMDHETWHVEPLSTRAERRRG